MNWTFLLIVAVLVVVVFTIKGAGQISVKGAQAYLKNGALVIDVRSPGEFSSGHLTNAINIPLDEITTAVPQRVKDKSQVLLLHCQSGMRSGSVTSTMKKLEYGKVLNLGSYGRAKEMLCSR